MIAECKELFSIQYILTPTCGALPKRSSGVDVHINIRSRSSESTFAISSAFLAASTAKVVKLSLPASTATSNRKQAYQYTINLPKLSKFRQDYLLKARIGFMQKAKQHKLKLHPLEMLNFAWPIYHKETKLRAAKLSN